MHGETLKQAEYLIITAFPLQHWLRERTSMLGYTYTVYLLLTVRRWQLCLTPAV